MAATATSAAVRRVRRNQIAAITATVQARAEEGSTAAVADHRTCCGIIASNRAALIAANESANSQSASRYTAATDSTMTTWLSTNAVAGRTPKRR